MAGPSENIPPHEAWLEVTKTPRANRVCDFPRNDPVTGEPICQIAMWVLTEEEQNACQAAAELFTRKLLKEIPKGDEARRGYDDLYNNAAAIEILYRACRRPDDLSKPFFPSPAEMRRHLTIDEVGVLFNQYMTVQVETGPIISLLSEDEVQTWVKRLGEGGSRFPLDFLSSEALKTLAWHLALQLFNLQMDTTSPGSQPESTS